MLPMKVFEPLTSNYTARKNKHPRLLGCLSNRNLIASGGLGRGLFSLSCRCDNNFDNRMKILFSQSSNTKDNGDKLSRTPIKVETFLETHVNVSHNTHSYSPVTDYEMLRIQITYAIYYKGEQIGTETDTLGADYGPWNGNDMRQAITPKDAIDRYDKNILASHYQYHGEYIDLPNWYQLWDKTKYTDYGACVDNRACKL